MTKSYGWGGFLLKLGFPPVVGKGLIVLSYADSIPYAFRCVFTEYDHGGSTIMDPDCNYYQVYQTHLKG